MKRWCLGGIGVLVLMSVWGCSGAEGNLEPSPNAAPFVLNVAVTMARLSLQAYQQLDDDQDEQPFELPKPYRLEMELMTQQRFAGEFLGGLREVPIGFIATANETIYIAFRGTGTISEWVSDVLVPQVDYAFIADGGQTHRGFTKVYQSIREVILDTVHNLIASGPYTTIHLTGHSLGGAIAILAAPELREETGLDLLMYNFATPRVGDPIFAQRYRELVPDSWRVFNVNDLVTTLPPISVTIIAGLDIRKFTYQHLAGQNQIEFGDAFDNPLDLFDFGFNHGLCNYYNRLCDQTNEPLTCRELADGADGCNR